MFSRRTFCSTVAASALAADAERYRVGITTNTRGGWEKDVWLSFREARSVGYRYVESFIHYFVDFMGDPAALQARIAEIGVEFVTISNGGPLEMHFEDPAKRAKLIDDHVRLVRFIRALGCKHLKINLGPRRKEGTTDADLREMAVTLNELGRRVSDEGLKLAVHAHMWSQFENGHEIKAVLDATDEKHVWFVLDTGHITMAGINPVKLAKSLGHRIVEFHLKDVDPVNRGGATSRLEVHEPMTKPVFFALGKGGVDFPGLLAHLDRIQWKGWLTVELDSSPDRPPVEAARESYGYLTRELKLRV